MTKYRQFRKAAANIIAQLLFFGNAAHERIHRSIKAAERGHIIVWQKIGLWLTNLYARVIPRNGNGSD